MGAMALQTIYSRLRKNSGIILLVSLMALALYFEFKCRFKVSIPPHTYSTQQLSANERQVLATHGGGSIAGRYRVGLELDSRKVRTAELPDSIYFLQFANSLSVTLDRSIKDYVFAKLYSNLADLAGPMRFRITDEFNSAGRPQFESKVYGHPIPLSQLGHSCVISDDIITLLKYDQDRDVTVELGSVSRESNGRPTRCAAPFQIFFYQNSHILAYCGEQEYVGAGDRGSSAEIYHIDGGVIHGRAKWRTYESNSFLQLCVRENLIHSISPDGKRLETRSFPNGTLLRASLLPHPISSSSDSSPYGLGDGDILWYQDVERKEMLAFDISTLNPLPSEFISASGKASKLLHWNSFRREAWYGCSDELCCIEPFSGTVIFSMPTQFAPHQIEYSRSRNSVFVHSEACDLRWLEITTDGSFSWTEVDGLANRRKTSIDTLLMIAAWSFVFFQALFICRGWFRWIYDRIFFRGVNWREEEPVYPTEPLQK